MTDKTKKQFEVWAEREGVSLGLVLSGDYKYYPTQVAWKAVTKKQGEF